MVTCGGDGSVPKDDVLSVLRECGISVQDDENGVTLIYDPTETVAVYKEFPDNVPRSMIHHLHHKFQVNIEYFYHPEMMRKQ